MINISQIHHSTNCPAKTPRHTTAKFVFICILVIVILLISSLLFLSDSIKRYANYTKYRRELYEIDLPKSWIRKENLADSSILTIRSPETPPYDSSIIIQEIEIPQGKEIGSLSHVLEEEFRNFSTTKALLSVQINIHGKMFLGQEVHAIRQGNQVRMRHLLIPAGRWGVDLTTIQPDEEHQAEIEAVLDSILIHTVNN